MEPAEEITVENLKAMGFGRENPPNHLLTHNFIKLTNDHYLTFEVMPLRLYLETYILDTAEVNSLHFSTISEIKKFISHFKQS